jgi:hypothetical protein
MANGAAVALPLAIEPLTVPAPQFNEALGGVEGWIGALMIGMLDISARALRESEDGEISSETKRQGGDLVARLYELSRGELDFAATVHHQAQLQLRQRHADLSAAEVDATACWILETVAKVAAMVRAELH